MMSTQQRLQPFFSILHPLDEPDIGAYKANRCILESSHWIIQMMIRRILWLPSNYFIPAIPARWRKQRPIMWCTSAWRWRWRMPSRAVGPPRLHWVCWSRLYRHLRFLRTKRFGSDFCTKGWFRMNRFCMTWTEPDAWPRALMASSFIVVLPASALPLRAFFGQFLRNSGGWILSFGTLLWLPSLFLHATAL